MCVIFISYLMGMKRPREFFEIQLPGCPLMTETCRVPPACTANQGPPPDPCLSARLTLTALWPVADTGPLDISRTHVSFPTPPGRAYPPRPKSAGTPLRAHMCLAPGSLGSPFLSDLQYRCSGGLPGLLLHWSAPHVLCLLEFMSS